MNLETAREGAIEPASVGGADVADLYRRHIASAAALAFLLTRDPAAAEDLAQDAFVQVVGRFRHLRRPEAFAPYLRRTVVNLCRTHFRRLRIERDLLGREGARRSEADPAETVSTSGSSPRRSATAASRPSSRSRSSTRTTTIPRSAPRRAARGSADRCAGRQAHDRVGGATRRLGIPSSRTSRSSTTAES